MSNKSWLDRNFNWFFPLVVIVISMATIAFWEFTGIYFQPEEVLR